MICKLYEEKRKTDSTERIFEMGAHGNGGAKGNRARLHEGWKQQQPRPTNGKCRGFAELPTGLASTAKEQFKIEMLRGDDLWRGIEGEHTRVWCGRCAGHAEPKLRSFFR